MLMLGTKKGTNLSSSGGSSGKLKDYGSVGREFKSHSKWAFPIKNANGATTLKLLAFESLQV